MAYIFVQRLEVGDNVDPSYPQLERSVDAFHERQHLELHAPALETFHALLCGAHHLPPGIVHGHREHRVAGVRDAPPPRALLVRQSLVEDTEERGAAWIQRSLEVVSAVGPSAIWSVGELARQEGAAGGDAGRGVCLGVGGAEGLRVAAVLLLARKFGGFGGPERRGGLT